MHKFYTNIDLIYLLTSLIVVVMYALLSIPVFKSVKNKHEVIEKKQNELGYKIWLDYKEQIMACESLIELGEIQDNIDLFYYNSNCVDATARSFYNSLALEITIRKRQLKERLFS